ncbi:hypothetical protein KC19_VG059200 [Ceratodon purpureus]|uniref:Uncharacterized protein n=1 Tax=Ceratodon purpureus TaxID=3225 RepID=A0A8T0HMD6_CERPU|nr:hypothetical protein KC19_VG059200 [Ceratodon purpureus]
MWNMWIGSTLYRLIQGLNKTLLLCTWESISPRSTMASASLTIVMEPPLQDLALHLK